MSSNATIISFSRQRDEASELLSCVERYSGNTAEHRGDPF
jgi:hypothetical protein